MPMKKTEGFLGLEVSDSEPADVSGVRSLGGEARPKTEGFQEKLN